MTRAQRELAERKLAQFEQQGSWQPKSFFANDRDRSEYYAQQRENWKAYTSALYNRTAH